GKCFGHLGNLVREHDAYRQAVSADTSWTPARLGLAAALVSLGRLDAAIAEYRRVVPPVPEAQVAVARLLVQRNLHLPPAERRWREVTAALDAASRADPGSASPSASDSASASAPIEVLILRAEALMGQGEAAAARKLLEGACVEYPRRSEPVV